MDIADYVFAGGSTTCEDLSITINWEKLQAYASELHQGEACNFEAQIGMGGRHYVRILTFEGGDRWLARWAIETSDERDCDAVVMRDADVLRILAERTTVPVPKVFAAVSDKAKFGAAIALMELLPGNPAIEHDQNDREVPEQYRSQFFKEMANAHVQISNINFPRIGTPIRLEDGSITVGPIPGIGGPFDTATDYIRAWAATAKWRRSREETDQLCGSAADEIWEQIQNFPPRLGELANLAAGPYDSGPFTLVNTDFGHQNIIVDEQYRMLGVIDFEDAIAAPWCLVDYPLTVRCGPIPSGNSDWYDSNGEVVDTGVSAQRKLREEYHQAIVEAERELGVPPRLSEALSNVKTRDVGVEMFHYGEEAIPGFFTRVLDQLEDKPWNPHTQAGNSSN